MDVAVVMAGVMVVALALATATRATAMVDRVTAMVDPGTVPVPADLAGVDPVTVTVVVPMAAVHTGVTPVMVLRKPVVGPRQHRQLQLLAQPSKSSTATINQRVGTGTCNGPVVFLISEHR